MAGKRSTTENPAERDDPAVGEAVVDSEAEKAELETPERNVRKSDRMPFGVMYVGTAHIREISAAAWKQAGVNDQEKVVWDNRNLPGRKNIVPLSELSQGAIEYCEQFDDGFVLVDENGKRV